VATDPVIDTRKPAAPEERERVPSDAELKAIWLACGNDDFGSHCAAFDSARQTNSKRSAACVGANSTWMPVRGRYPESAAKTTVPT
jgi:hypothetical protein